MRFRLHGFGGPQARSLSLCQAENSSSRCQFCTPNVRPASADSPAMGGDGDKGVEVPGIIRWTPQEIPAPQEPAREPEPAHAPAPEKEPELVPSSSLGV
jgi:hypothetical protein